MINMTKMTIFFDNRQPLFIPYYYWKALVLKGRFHSVAEPTELHVLLTFDIENSWGAEEQRCQQENTKFLERIQEIRNSKTTYFVTANLVSTLAPSLKELAIKNELGLHGYCHELWKPAHFVQKKAVKKETKKKLIKKSIGEFVRNGLERPLAFRAPYMWRKKSDLELLKKNGFKVDSSDPAQKGFFSVTHDGDILRMPVTASPIPYFKSRNGLAYTEFRQFNLTTLNELQNAEFSKFVSQILKMQIYLKTTPYLLFTGHPWEFFGRWRPGRNEEFRHRGEENYKVLKTKLALLEESYSVKYVTISEFKDLWEKENSYR